MSPERSSRVPRLPGALRRLGRDRVRLIAVVLLVIVTVSASGIQSAAASILQHTLDANWRGAYDILVTAKSSKATASPAQSTSAKETGLLPPNSLSAGDNGMSLADVAKIRTVAGIDVAAPIGEVEFSQLRWSGATIAIPEGTVDATTTPQAFSVTADYTTDDGLGSRFVDRQKMTLVVDQTPKPPAPPQQPCMQGDIVVDITKYPLLCGMYEPYQSDAMVISDGASGGAGTVNGVIYAQMWDTPASATRVTLIDPVAERKLLGGGADFLRQLEVLKPTTHTSAKDMTAWASTVDSPFASEFLAQQQARDDQTSAYTESAFQQQYDAFAKEHGLPPMEQDERPEPFYVPLLAARAGAAPLTLTTTVRALGAAPRSLDSVETNSSAYSVPKAQGTPVGSSSVDASALLNPFATHLVEVPWPETHPPKHDADPSLNTLFISSAGAIDGSHYWSAADTGTLTTDRFARPVARQGAPNATFATERSGREAGMESVYSPVTELVAPAQGAYVVPVGSFSTAQLAGLQSELSYVPLGAYQSAQTTVTEFGSSRTLKPSVTGLGLVNPRTIAIGSLSSAPIWSQNRPVSAVRVRVAGVSDYSAQSQERVAAVAQAIHALGFTTTVVAGSSPTKVALTVDNYAFGVTNPDSTQRIGSLGTVHQYWSRLGAAARADTAVSAASVSVLAIALGAVVLLLGAVQLVSIPRRREEAAGLRQIGWPAARVRRWMAAEELPGVVAVLLAAVVTIALSGLARTPLIVAGTTTAAVVLTSLVAVGVGSRTRVRARTARAPRASATRSSQTLRSSQTYRVTSPLRFGVRQARVNLLSSIVLGLAILVVGFAAAGLTDLVLRGRKAAGASLLAQFTTGQAALSQLALAIVALAAGIALSLFVSRMSRQRRSEHTAALRAMGWTARQLRAARRAELTVITVPAVLVCAELASVGAALAGTPDRSVLVLVTVIAAVLAAALLFPARVIPTRVVSATRVAVRRVFSRTNGSRA